MNPLKHQIEQERQPQRKRNVTQKKQQKKKSGLYSLQGLIGMAACGVFVLLIGQLYLDAEINEYHYKIETMRLEIEKQAVANEELYSKISELSTYSRAMEIAKENGLATNENTITIGE